MPWFAFLLATALKDIQKNTINLTTKIFAHTVLKRDMLLRVEMS